MAAISAKLVAIIEKNKNHAQDLEAKCDTSKQELREMKAKLAEAQKAIKGLHEELEGRIERLDWTPLQRFEADQLVGRLLLLSIRLIWQLD